MTDPRGTLSSETRLDLDALIDTLLPVAQNLLARYGEFHPFGAFMRSDGTIELVAGYDGTDQPSNENLIEILLGTLRTEARGGELRAGGICVRVRATPPDGSARTHAARLNLEHVSGAAVEVYLPYRRTIFRRFRYGDLFEAPVSERSVGLGIRG